jgi:hypothetical protein
VSQLADGQLDAALDDSRGNGVAGEAGDLVDVELGHEILPVFLDRLDADAEFRRSFSHELPAAGVLYVSQKSLIALAISVSWLTSGGLTRYPLAPKR